MSSSSHYPSEEEYGYTMRSVQRPFHKKFPTIAGIFIGFLQMLLNGAIIGLEGGSVAYNRKIDIVYAGFWCSISFFFTWVSMYAFLCFRKSLRWGFVVAGMNFASIVFATILIIFDSLFILNPCQCYLATICDVGTSTNYGYVYNCTGSDGKLRVVKAQLAMTATMLASNIGYILLFFIIFIFSRPLRKPLHPSYRPSFQTMPPPPPHNSSPQVLSTLPMRTPTNITTRQSFQNQSSYSPRRRELAYPDQTSYWRPATPYFNQFEKF